MDSYTPPYSFTNRMMQLVASISEKVGKIDVYNNLDARPHLRKNNRIRSIHSSLRIEANSLSLDNVRDVINGHTVLGPANEIQEVKNAAAAYSKLKEINPYSIDDLKMMHGIMENDLMVGAGKFRKNKEGVFNGDTCIFMAPPPALVPQLINDLFSWMNSEKNVVHPLIMSAIFHYEFVFIHPFSDGNGRTARLWHTAMLTKWNPIFEFIPLESQIEKFQEGYYDAIAACHKDGNSNKFIEFMLERIDEILDEVAGQVRHADDSITEAVNKLLDVMDFEVPYTSNELMSRLDMKSRAAFRENYLNPAIKLGLVAMSIPDKPTSRNQRYIKK